MAYPRQYHVLLVGEYADLVMEICWDFDGVAAFYILKVSFSGVVCNERSDI